eukprot:TRINITY_DN11515_c0_g1_i1.p2 TRINITY_DN11515_c0_g1~~TRINITY_DN11515_c0_g1_i1.p2  ORF type:complete len:286 (+),score=52.27 TRINITY_DN11515_c0_g1_i1:46-903(+)
MWNSVFPLYKPEIGDNEFVPPHVMERLRTKGHWVPEYAEGTFLVYASDYMINHIEIPFITMMVYLFLVWYLTRMMKNRPAFDLRGPLFWWNMFLAVFSAIGAFYVVPPHVKAIWENGFTYDYCSADEEYASPWTLYFCLSKIPELIDTIFIILRKRPLVFLHWYHHVATMWFCWMAWALKLQCGGAFAAMNLTVHTVMYSYFAFSTRGVRFPNILRIGITSMQIFQMVGGTEIVIHTLLYCPYGNKPLLVAGLLMYISYFLLFSKLFYENYCIPAKQTSKKDKAN